MAMLVALGNTVEGDLTCLLDLLEEKFQQSIFVKWYKR